MPDRLFTLGGSSHSRFTATHPRVRAHVFLCLLAHHVEWHMRRALSPLLFDDGELNANRKTPDPPAKAEPSRSAQRKKAQRVTPDGLPVHSQYVGSPTRLACSVGPLRPTSAAAGQWWGQR